MNPILSRCEALAAAGRHITAVGAEQRGDGVFEIRITLQDWATGDDLLAGAGGLIEMTVRERLPDVVFEVESTLEMLEDWIVEVAHAGEAIDWAKFERAGYRSWLTKPNKWVKSEFRAIPRTDD
jgi:hypothetical protein